MHYRDIWIAADKLACKHEEEEFNINTNKKWKNCRKSDGRKLWEAIDWKGKGIKRKSEELSAEAVSNYFKLIFQSPKTLDKPSLDTKETLQNGYVQKLDQNITNIDVNLGIKKGMKGTSLDGISPDIMMILPVSMRNLLCHLFNKVFSTKPYPTKWQQQLLFPYPKKGHKPSYPKSRGVGIGPVLSRIYFSILNSRFCNCYVPNKEQAGFRKSQGCLLQIFSVYLLMELAKANDSELFIAFMDYEKAFDFLNRKLLIEKLLEKNAGGKFINAVHNMYSNTSYTPKLSDSTLGNTIPTKHGVTQGKVSSANLYSFYVSDMRECLTEYKEDFMDPINLCQLADDTALFASTIASLSRKLSFLFSYSDSNHQVVNIGKTKFIHLSKSPNIEPIRVSEKEYVESAYKKATYIYL